MKINHGLWALGSMLVMVIALLCIVTIAKAYSDQTTLPDYAVCACIGAAVLAAGGLFSLVACVVHESDQ